MLCGGICSFFNFRKLNYYMLCSLCSQERYQQYKGISSNTI
uniref:Uncharacterized protein n=1 Tax=Arundo donax TaxID=35708 RepID=A0A0A9DNG2_ARUDO